VLVVEDDFAIRNAIDVVLTDEGYDVVSAAHGREALSILADNRVRPGLIILDLWMPSMDGLEFRALQQSYARWADIPVLVITASRLVPRELGPLGLHHVLRKPLDLYELLGKTRELISR
jgi:CheY-like chemotaxis protein